VLRSGFGSRKGSFLNSMYNISVAGILAGYIHVFFSFVMQLFEWQGLMYKCDEVTAKGVSKYTSFPYLQTYFIVM